MKIILHIGGPKCGSSAIQAFLGEQRDMMLSRGFIIPGPDLGLDISDSQQVWFFERLRRNPEQGAEELCEALSKLEEQLPSAMTVVISAENLYNFGCAPVLFSRIKSSHDISVILYIRRQDEFMISAWKQWYFKVEPDFWAWMLANVRETGNWRRSIELWETAIGSRNITVRIFDKKHLVEGDVVADFCSILGVSDLYQPLQAGDSQRNASLSDALIELLRSGQMMRDANDTRFTEVLRTLTLGKLDNGGQSRLLNAHQRNAVMRVHAPGNEWLRSRYLQHIEGELFPGVNEQATDIRDPVDEKFSTLMIILKGLIEAINVPSHSRLQ